LGERKIGVVAPLRDDETDGKQNCEDGFAGDEAGSEQRAALLEWVLARCGAMRSASHFNMPPTKMAAVVSNGRYMPTAMSIGAGASIMISAMPKTLPMSTRPPDT